MERMVKLRSLEDRDLDFVYKCRNDRSLAELSINGFQPMSYEDATMWFDKCIHDDGTYKYWAVCTDDEFQNIIGWCSISKIDYKKKEAMIYGITIADRKYRDSSALFFSGITMVDYIFQTLGLDKVWAECLNEQLNTKFFLDLVLQKSDRVDANAVCRNGSFYDILTYSLSREKYEEKKKNGMLDYEYCVSKLKEQIGRNLQINNISLNVFFEKFCALLYQTNPSSVTVQTKFKDLDEWSSLFAIEVAALVENVCKVRLNANDLQDCETIEDLYNKAMNKR